MVTYFLMAIIVIISAAALIWPPLTDVIGGVGALAYPWQPWTAVFVHGWPGMPVLLHLTSNLILLAVVGPSVERWLGSRRFLIVTFAAILVAGILRLLLGVEFNGASAFVWSYAPLLWFFSRNVQQTDKAGILYVMWLIIPVAMGIAAMLNDADLFTALVLGNLYHLSGTAVGFGALWFWKDLTSTHGVGGQQ